MGFLPRDPLFRDDQRGGGGPPLWILPPKETYCRKSLESHGGFQRGRAPFVSSRGGGQGGGTPSKVSLPLRAFAYFSHEGKVGQGMGG